MRFHTHLKQCNLIPLNIDGTLLSYQESVRFLGVELDHCLNWGRHCDSVISKLSSSCYLFKCLRHLLDRNQLIMLYHAEVGARLHYAIILWGNSLSAKEVLLRQKRVIRSMLGLHPTDSCRPWFKSLKILTLPSLFIFVVCVYIFKYKHVFQLNSDVHNVNTRNRSHFNVGFARLSITRNLPRYIGLIVFNCLPETIKNHSTLNSFKTNLKSILMDTLYSYSLDEFYTRC